MTLQKCLPVTQKMQDSRDLLEILPLGYHISGNDLKVGVNLFPVQLPILAGELEATGSGLANLAYLNRSQHTLFQFNAHQHQIFKDLGVYLTGMG